MDQTSRQCTIEGFLSEDEVLEILRLKKSTLDARRSVGTEHPPYIKAGRVRLYPIDQFQDWLRKRPIMYEVSRLRRKHAS